MQEIRPPEVEQATSTSACNCQTRSCHSGQKASSRSYAEEQHKATLFKSSKYDHRSTKHRANRKQIGLVTNTNQSIEKKYVWNSHKHSPVKHRSSSRSFLITSIDGCVSHPDFGLSTDSSEVCAVPDGATRVQTIAPGNKARPVRPTAEKEALGEKTGESRNIRQRQQGKS